jgi:hypothetical protein
MIVRVTATGGSKDSVRVDVPMPNLVGLSLGGANQKLDSLGMAGWREPLCEDGSPGTDPSVGSIVRQKIPVGELTPSSKRITFWVACGAAPAPEPEDQFLD